MFACNWVSLGRRDGEENLPLALVVGSLTWLIIFKLC